MMRRGGPLLTALAAAMLACSAAMADADPGLPSWLQPSPGAPAPVDRNGAEGAEMEAMAARMEAQIEQTFGASPDEMSEMSGAELLLRFGVNALSRSAEGAGSAGTAPPSASGRLPIHGDGAPTLRHAPHGGFPDGAEPLPTSSEGLADLSVTGAPRDALLVVADPVAQEALLVEDVRLPLARTLNLGTLSPRFPDLVVELMDPSTRRIIHRYRPVENE